MPLSNNNPILFARFVFGDNIILPAANSSKARPSTYWIPNPEFEPDLVVVDEYSIAPFITLGWVIRVSATAANNLAAGKASPNQKVSFEMFILNIVKINDKNQHILR